VYRQRYRGFESHALRCACETSLALWLTVTKVARFSDMARRESTEVSYRVIIAPH
jgi:hypothetical protein